VDPSIGIVLPAYRPDVPQLLYYIKTLRLVEDINVVHIELDDSHESTADTLLQSTHDDVTVAVSPDRRGKGAAITAGFETLDTEVLAYADADGSTPVSSIVDLVAPVAAGRPFSIRSRRHPEATVVTHQTVIRRHLGNAFAALAHRFLDIDCHDFQCGAKAISKEAWTDIRDHLYEPGFAWDVELVAVADAVGHEPVEVPITWKDQPDSTVSPTSTALALARALLVVRHRTRVLNGNPLHQLLGQPPPPPLITQYGNR